jgi:hypothetical protein
MILRLTNFLYGGIHAAALNECFPSAAEKWFWRARATLGSAALGGIELHHKLDALAERILGKSGWTARRSGGKMSY